MRLLSKGFELVSNDSQHTVISVSDYNTLVLKTCTENHIKKLSKSVVMNSGTGKSDTHSTSTSSGTCLDEELEMENKKIVN